MSTQEPALAFAWTLAQYGDAPAVVSLSEGSLDEQRLSYRELDQRARAVANGLQREVARGGFVGLLASNSCAWVAADLALLLGGFVEVSVPLGFTAEQAAHLLKPCSVVLVDEAGRRRLEQWHREAALNQLRALDIAALSAGATSARSAPPAEDWICKVIHTSGTTNTPKGVRIRAQALASTLASLAAWTRPEDYARYLNLVPFSLLLEQLVALYLPFSRGGCVVLTPASQPLVGDPNALIEDKLALIQRAAPSACTLTPSLVEAIRGAAEIRSGLNLPDRNRALFGTEQPPLLAAGGGPVARSTLERLAELGIDVLVGYGLSETSSVVCWNPRHANRLGTVGVPLPGVACKISPEGELGVRTPALFAGYLGEDPSACVVDERGWLWTGDLATIDEAGYVTITGRKKNVIITAHGRNVAPEFVEATYRQVPGVRECVVFGDDDDALSALVLLDDDIDATRAEQQLSAHGAVQLSSVERVTQFYCLPHSDCPLIALFTLTGRPRRQLVVDYVRDRFPRAALTARKAGSDSASNTESSS